MLQSFHCFCNGKSLKTQLTESHLILNGNDNTVSFTLSFSLCIYWIVDGQQIIGYEIDDLVIMADHDNLSKLRMRLGKCVIFKGIRNLYDAVDINNDFLNIGNNHVHTLVHKIDQVRYAVKCLDKSEYSQNSFLEKITLLFRLHHPNVITTIEIFESKHKYYLVMEYLYPIVSQEQDHEDIKLIIQQILQGIQYVHSLQIAHHNLNLSHIMIDQQNTVKIVGFGKAISMDSDTHKGSQETQTYTKFDMFDIGAIMYELYTKQPLHDSKDNSTMQLTGTVMMNEAKFQLPNIPEYGSDLLRMLLETNQKFAYPAEQALRHPYLKYCDQRFAITLAYSMQPKFKKYIESRCQKQFLGVTTQDHLQGITISEIHSVD